MPNREAPRGEPRRDRAPRLSNCRSSGSRRWRWLRRTTRVAPRALGGRDGRDRLVPGLRGAHPRGEVSGADAIHPGYGFLAENAGLRGGGRGGRADLGRALAGGTALGGDKLAAKRIAREAGVPVLPEGTPDEIGFPLLVKAAAGAVGAACASCGPRASWRRRWRQRNARPKARSATARSTSSATSSARATSRCSSSPTRTGRSSRSASATAPCSGGTRRCSRRRRRPALPGLRGALHGSGRVRLGGRVPERGNRRVRPRRRRVLLPRAERPHPGRAPRHGGGDGPRPSRSSSRSPREKPLQQTGTSSTVTQSRCGSTPRIQGRSCRRRAGSIGSAAKSCGLLQQGRECCASTPASRRATKSASPTTR